MFTAFDISLGVGRRVLYQLQYVFICKSKTDPVQPETETPVITTGLLKLLLYSIISIVLILCPRRVPGRCACRRRLAVAVLPFGTYYCIKSNACGLCHRLLVSSFSLASLVLRPLQYCILLAVKGPPLVTPCQLRWVAWRTVCFFALSWRHVPRTTLATGRPAVVEWPFPQRQRGGCADLGGVTAVHERAFNSWSDTHSSKQQSRH